MLENGNPRTAVLFRSAVLLLMCGLWDFSVLAAEARTQDQDEAPEPLRPTDELLEELVGQALAKDGVVERYELVVNVLDGSVTLYGTVDTRRERERAGAVAGDVSGVREVANRIQVAKELLPNAPSDETIHEHIVEALSREGGEASEVEVVVEDALATLTGVVSSEERRRELSELAFRAGAALVRNELKVEKERKDGT